MDQLKFFDLKIGDALECLVQAISVIKKSNEDQNKKIAIKLGRIISELWEVRNYLYKIDPSLKPNLVVEGEKDRDRYRELTILQNQAYEKEQAGNMEAAAHIYGELLSRSKYGYFQRVAEAGLFRVNREQ